MAGFDFGKFKNRFSKADNHVGDDSARPEDDYGAMDEGAGEYDDDLSAGYADDYEQGEADGYADDDQYDAEYAGDDGYDEEDNYDDGYADDYEEAPAYEDAEDEGDAETLGYNPAIFSNLDDGEQADDDRSYDDYDEGDYDEEDEGGYPDGDYDDEPDARDNGDQYESEASGGFVGYITSNDWVMFLALVILPPLGIWLLWRRNKFDITLRTTLSAASLIWMIIILIVLLTRGGSDDNTLPTPNFNQPQSVAPSTPTDTNVAETTPTTEPTSTPRINPQDGAGSPNAGAEGDTQYYWVTNTGVYYHTLENCGGQINASKVTLQTATNRNLSACPDCAGGTNKNATGGTSTLYARSGGTWYHTDPTCQGMKNATVVTEANAIKDGKRACPQCIGYYGRLDGKYYHVTSNCSSMKNAITKSEQEWIANGNTKCPTCILSGAGGSGAGNAGTKPTSTMVYATPTGKWYHTDSKCQGMKGAVQGSIANAIVAKKTPCPKCISPSTLYVFATPGGKNYHTKNTCSGMKNAQYVTAATAIKAGKSACTECASMLTTASAGGGAAPLATGEKATYVYATQGGKYFHVNNTCTGMKGAQRVTFAQAVSAGKTMCTTCVAPAKLTVFATGGGKYFHTNSTCTSMKDAVSVLASTALAYGKTACPTCAKALTGAKAATTTGGGGTTVNQAASASSTVYIKLGAASNLYHLAAKCTAQNVTGGSNVTLEYALNHGYSACPSCKPPSKIYQ